MMAMLVSKSKFCNNTKSDLFELISIYNVGLRPLGCVGSLFALKVHFCRLTALTEHQLTSEFHFSVATYVTSDLKDYYKRDL